MYAYSLYFQKKVAYIGSQSEIKVLFSITLEVGDLWIISLDGVISARDCFSINGVFSHVISNLYASIIRNPGVLIHPLALSLLARQKVVGSNPIVRSRLTSYFSIVFLVF